MIRKEDIFSSFKWDVKKDRPDVTMDVVKVSVLRETLKELKEHAYHVWYNEVDPDRKLDEKIIDATVIDKLFGVILGDDEKQEEEYKHFIVSDDVEARKENE